MRTCGTTGESRAVDNTDFAVAIKVSQELNMTWLLLLLLEDFVI